MDSESDQALPSQPCSAPLNLLCPGAWWYRLLFNAYSCLHAWHHPTIIILAVFHGMSLTSWRSFMLILEIIQSFDSDASNPHLTRHIDWSFNIHDHHFCPPPNLLFTLKLPVFNISTLSIFFLPPRSLCSVSSVQNIFHLTSQSNSICVLPLLYHPKIQIYSTYLRTEKYKTFSHSRFEPPSSYVSWTAKMHHSTPLLSFSLAFLAALAPQVRGHSWVEQLMVIGPDNYYVGESGYPRGYGQPVPLYSCYEALLTCW